ncbi:MAG TPA: hypothetical protein PK052_11850 [Anaerohalosphaeraceae bacterium]|nr:hypothetical protein [Anaerohalosphaeraceae bacterium]HOL32659.1 hypothetical protein [Anaerohalosphaeraceae bacterium]HOM77239.1 hypothetical protein [Anaerohalosphaeraceae bacterium]HPC65471.1 hypothetical protein [Anaerohalosphaeraceae bacterium]HPO70946.1 hypothetical protein [Anaerohalosphaeraceae bacterium]
MRSSFKTTIVIASAGFTLSGVGGQQEILTINNSIPSSQSQLLDPDNGLSKNIYNLRKRKGSFMKRNIYWVMIIILAIMPCAMGTTVITNVQVSPAQPSFFDIITIASYGSFSGGTNWYDKSEFTIDEQSLYLNLYFTGGFGPQITQPWSHNDVIGTLPQGNYDLSVQAYWRVSGGANYILHDNYSISFEVIPEPLMLTFLVLGSFFVRRKCNK